MDSINIIKGYNKVDHTHQNPFPPPPHKSIATKKRLSAVATVAAILCLTFFIGLILAALIQHSTTESPNSAESIKTVCGVTQYPDTCFTSISSLNQNRNPDPESIFKLSLLLTIDSLKNATSLFNGRHSQAALQDCATQLDDALARLNDSVSQMEAGPLTDRKVNDIQTWISAAMTDRETCLDGLKETGSTALDEVKARFDKSKQLLSISLAIIHNINLLLHKFGLTMH